MKAMVGRRAAISASLTALTAIAVGGCPRSRRPWVLQRHQGRISQLHVKDFRRGAVSDAKNSPEFCEVGSGSIDWTITLDIPYRTGVRRFLVEREAGASLQTVEAVRRSFDYLARLVV
jgi:sugar phosphate isomerase/epimerase